MASIKAFEDIVSWQKSRALNHELYLITGNKNYDKYLDLSRQIRRASSSVMANISEGYERQTNKEFIQFLFIAKGSLAEVRSFLYISLDLGLIQEKEFEHLKKETIEIAGLISKFITYLKNSNH